MKRTLIEKGLGVILAIVVTVTALGCFTLPVGDAIVLSGSMEPALSVNDMVFFSKMKEYKAGDIVVFRDGDMTSVHRIVKRSKDQIITKGDFNNAEDPPISQDKILGKVIMSIPQAGVIFEREYVLFIVLALLIIMLFLGRKPKYE